MRFPSRDLSEQYISSSYQDVLQRYINTDSFHYILDGYGTVVLGFPTASVGYDIITSNVTSSMSVNSASYAYIAENADQADFALLSGNTLYTASYAKSSSFTETSSYLYGGGTILRNLRFDTASATSASLQEGSVFWDNSTKTLGIYSDIPNLNLQLGQSVWIRAVANETIPKGSAVYSSGSVGSIPLVNLAMADGTLSTARSEVIGLASEAITSGSIGIIITLGLVYNLDTSAFINGQQVYLSDINSGSFRALPPADPAETVGIGYVARVGTTDGIVQVYINNQGAKSYPFVGMVTVPTLSNTGSSTGSIVNVGSCLVNLSDTLVGAGYVRNYPVPAASFVVTSSFLDVQHLVVTYNSGSPIYRILTDYSAIDDIQTTTAATFTIGTRGDLSYIDWDNPGVLLANKLHQRIIDIFGAERASGLDISTSGSHINITSGEGWLGAKQLTFTTSSTATNNFVLLSHSASVWSGSLVSGWVSNKYDNGTNTVTLGTNKYVVNYIWRGIGSLNRSQILLSTQFNNYADAVSAVMPAPPEELKNIAILLGRIITQEGNATPLLLESTFTTIFSIAGITTHNDLGGIQGGSGGQYYHLTAAEYTQLQNGTASYSVTSSYSENYNKIPYTHITGSYSLKNNDYLIYANASSGSMVLVMPTPSLVPEQIFKIKKVDSTGYEVIISSSVNIDYDTELRLSQRGSSVTLHSDSTQYWIH